jgi:hypothetical protein
MRTVALALALAAVLPAAGVWEEVNHYCVACHNPQLKTAGLSLAGAGATSPVRHPEVWEKVLRRLRGRTMPPAGGRRPDEAAYQRLIAWLESELDTLPVNPGRTDTFRRLSRAEYRNAVRDLLGLEVDAGGLLPADEISHGFDNASGELSPTLLERYLQAARKISRQAVGVTPRAAGGDTFHLPPDLTQEEHFEGFPLGTRGGIQIPYFFPVTGEYEVQIRLARDRNEHVEGLHAPHDVELLLDGERLRMFTVKPPPPGDDHAAVDRHLRARITVSAGSHQLMVTFPKRPSVLLETERQPYHAHFNMDRHPRLQPAIYSVTVNGPFDSRGADESPTRKRIFGCYPATRDEEEPCAREIVARLMRRAYRRAVTEADLAAPLRLYRQTRAAEGFDAGIEMALRAILVSPEFLLRVEQDPAGVSKDSVYPISDVELASRLSFFLWSSIPDDELLEVAINGQLRQPGVLEAQVRRMLHDTRARALTENFADQWLHLRNLGGVTPDMRLFTDFDDNLRQAFRRETQLFFDSIRTEDRSVADLLRARYTFLNERLAKHYGVAGVYGSRFRRVELPAGARRGGLLRHGSVLTVTSYATRTSPVLRGKWILENLLGITPPPPPPAVPALRENSGAAGRKMTVRERLAEHRKNPACSGCHQLMDPAGFALENYDATGRWRESEESLPLDTRGGLPDGSEFMGVDGLENALLSRREVFVGAFTEKLLTYALGRGTAYYDGPAIRKILRAAAKQDYRLSAIVLGIVASEPFQLRRAK